MMFDSPFQLLFGISMILAGAIQLFFPGRYLNFRKRLGWWGRMDALEAFYSSRHAATYVRISGSMFVALGLMAASTA